MLPLICHAEVGMQCKQYEYAQLKDSSKDELLSMYCTAAHGDKFNTEQLHQTQELARELLSKGQDSGYLRPMMREYLDAKRSCLVTTNAAFGMLNKRYKIKPPSCK